jgi:hypothetical protein
MASKAIDKQHSQLRRLQILHYVVGNGGIVAEGALNLWLPHDILFHTATADRIHNQIVRAVGSA